jgi:hypothetical protein
MSVNIDRIDATGAHIVRGLYFAETGKPVDAGTTVLVRSLVDVQPSHPLLLSAAHLFHLCADQRKREIGSAFSYAAGFRDNISVWILLLYGFNFWVATTGPIPDDFNSNIGVEPSVD